MSKRSDPRHRVHDDQRGHFPKRLPTNGHHRTLTPNLHPRPEQQSLGAGDPVQGGAVTAPGEEASTEPTTSTSLNPQPLPAPQGGSTMYTDNAGFDRLRYLFWRYLDWRQRLKVLVDVDALPNTADQPVPQTLERVALDTAAKNTGKLHDLWEAIMPLVPEDKRGANPFPSKDR